MRRLSAILLLIGFTMGTAGPLAAECAEYMTCDRQYACYGNLVGTWGTPDVSYRIIFNGIDFGTVTCWTSLCVYGMHGDSNTNWTLFDWQGGCSFE